MTNWIIRILGLVGVSLSFLMAIIYAVAGIAFLFVFAQPGAVTASNAQGFVHTNAVLSSNIAVQILTLPWVIELSTVSWTITLFWMFLHSFGSSYHGIYIQARVELQKRRGLQ